LPNLAGSPLAVAIAGNLCAWLPLVWFYVDDEFPDDALLYSATVTTGPTDPNALGSFPGTTLCAPFGDNAGRQAAIVLAVNGPHNFARGTDSNGPQTCDVAFTPPPLAGLCGATAVRGGQYGMIDFWRFTVPGNNNLGTPRDRETVSYAPGGQRIRKGDRVTVSMLVQASTLDMTGTYNDDYEYFAANIDIRLAIMLRGNADIYARG
jgi:hypothetical protein